MKKEAQGVKLHGRGNRTVCAAAQATRVRRARAGCCGAPPTLGLSLWRLSGGTVLCTQHRGREVRGAALRDSRPWQKPENRLTGDRN